MIMILLLILLLIMNIILMKNIEIIKTFLFYHFLKLMKWEKKIFSQNLTTKRFMNILKKIIQNISHNLLK